MLVTLYILNDDLHVHHVKYISTSSGCTYDMAYSIYIRPCTHITHLQLHMLALGGQLVLLVKTWPLTSR